MRHAEEAPEHVRILLTFLTPEDHTIRLRVGKVLEHMETTMIVLAVSSERPKPHS